MLGRHFSKQAEKWGKNGPLGMVPGVTVNF